MVTAGRFKLGVDTEGILLEDSSPCNCLRHVHLCQFLARVGSIGR